MSGRQEERQTSKASLALAVVGLAVLHVFLTLHYPGAGGRNLLRVHPDLLLLLVPAALLVAKWGLRAWVAHLAVLSLIWIALLYVIEGVFSSVYGRDFVLYSDVLMADGLWVYLTDNRSTAAAVTIALSAALGLVATWAVLYFSMRAVLRCATRPAGLLVILGTAQLAVVGFWVEASMHRGERPGLFRASMLVQSCRHAAVFAADKPWLDPGRLAERRRAAEEERSRLGDDLSGLGGAHVGVVFLESYGRVLFRYDKLREALLPDVKAWERRLAESGFSARTAYATSPVVGADSHVAHTELLAGIEVDNKAQVNLLLDTDAKCMAHYFAAAGYETVNVQPKLLVDWPKGGFYGFEIDLFGKHTGYHETPGAPRYHWAVGPDQYYLQQLLKRHFGPGRRPVFFQYVSVNTHAPFTVIPPYLEDWAKAEDPENFVPVKRFDLDMLNYFRHPEAVPAFCETLRSSMRTLVGLASELRDEPTLLIVLGDHQPPLLAEERRTFDVPVHVIANRPGLLEPFAKRGFVQGLLPPAGQGATRFRMSRILPRLLEDFSRPR